MQECTRPLVEELGRNMREFACNSEGERKSPEDWTEKGNVAQLAEGVITQMAWQAGFDLHHHIQLNIVGYACNPGT